MGLLKDIKTQLKILESVNEGLSTSKVKRIKKKIESDKDFQKYFRDTGEDYDQALEMWLEDEGYSIGIESAEEAEELADAISQLPESVNEGLSTSDQQKVEKMFYAAKDKLGSRYNWKTHLTPIYHAISKKLKLNIDDVSGYLNLVGESVNEAKIVVTGEYEGKPQKFSGSSFDNYLKDIAKISKNSKDFVDKIVMGITDETSDISRKDRGILAKWYSNVSESVSIKKSEFSKMVNELVGEILSEKDWIQKVTKSIEKKGTEGVCTGNKFGGPTCKPGTKRYNLAKTFKKMAKDKKKG